VKQVVPLVFRWINRN